MQKTFKILCCDHMGLSLDQAGQPDPSEVKAHIDAKGGVFHIGVASHGVADDGKLHFFYLPDLSTRDEFLELTDRGQFDAVIAAATFIPSESVFALGGVRIGAGTGNMGSHSWGGPNGVGGVAPLMNTPGFNARATAQMAFKALLHFRPSLPLAILHERVVAGVFDTGKNLKDFPTAKLEGQRIAIIGYGNIGGAVARLAAAFGMKVHVAARAAHHARIEGDGFIAFSAPQHAARGADVISIHTGLGALDQSTGRAANAGLIGPDILSVLNIGATVLNFDRGECVDVPALDQAMAAGRVAHAAIDADIFKAADGAVHGPMVPYLPLAAKYPGRLLLLPHAAADTDHPSRVAGAKQAVEQIFDAILHQRVTNLKGDLPPGYVSAGTKSGI